jgi:Tfp pilus assembly protein FimT
VVIVILGVLASLVLGYQLRLRNEQRLIAGSKALIGWLDEVRRRSIQQSAPCTVTVTAASGTMAAAAANACGAFPPFSLANAVPTANDLELCVALADPFAAAGNCPGGAASADLVFTPRGTTTTSALLQLHITNHAPNRCVAVIAPLGLLRVGRVDGGFCDWNRVS